MTDNLDCISDVHIAGKKLFLIQGDDPQLLNCEEYGLRIGVLKGTLKSTETAEVAVVALVGGQFVFPENTKLVSAVYAIFVSQHLLQPLKLDIQHCVSIDTEEHSTYLSFATAANVDVIPYQFVLKEGGQFSSKSQYGSIFLSQFSLWGIVKAAVKAPFRRLFLQFQRNHITTPDDRSTPITTPDDRSTPITTPDDRSTPITTPDDRSTPITTPDDRSTPITIQQMIDQLPSLHQMIDQLPSLHQMIDQLPSLHQMIDQLPSLHQMIDQLPSLQQMIDQLPSLQQMIDQLPSLQQMIDQLPSLQQMIDQLPSLQQMIDQLPSLHQMIYQLHQMTVLFH